MDTPELTQLLLSMHSTLRQDIDRSRRELSHQHQRDHDKIQAQLTEIVAQQKIANGRTTTNERAIQAITLHVKRLAARTGREGALYTKKTKAALASGALMIAGAVAEGIHQLIPKLIAYLSQAPKVHQ